MRLSAGVSCLLLVIAAASFPSHARLIGFPLSNRTDVVEYDLATGSMFTLVENLGYATSVYVWSSTSNSESNTVYFHALPVPLNSAFFSLVKVELQTKTVQSLPLVPSLNASKSLPFFHKASGTVFDLIVVQNKFAGTGFVALVQVDFAANKTTLVKKYPELDAVGYAVLNPQGSGSIIATVSVKNARDKTIAINLLTGDYEDFLDYKFDPALVYLRWLTVGLNSDATVIAILALDTSLTIGGQSNMSVIHWNLADGSLSLAGPPFLFPPTKDTFASTPDLVSSTFDVTSERFFAAFSDRSSASGIIEVDAATGKFVQFAAVPKWHEAREITVL